jgi:SAM-dependent methyltransferase
MNDNTIEIRDEEIDVDKIMAKIRENIRRRQLAGEIPPDPDSIITPASNIAKTNMTNVAFQQDLSYITSNWDIHNNGYFISSHNPFIGKFLVRGRQIVHGEVRRYVDPIISRQTEFNASTVRLHTQYSQKNIDLECKISLQREELIQKVSQLEEKLTQNVSRLEEDLNTNIQKYIDAKFREVFSNLDKDLQLRIGLTQILEEQMHKLSLQKSIASEPTSLKDVNYFLFEEQFRGSREVIKERQQAFLPFFENCSHVLDIGCGRGEFLELLKDHNIRSVGVDLDPDMIAYCRSRQLEVDQSDAIVYLEKMSDKSLDGIFIDQVVEHLEPDYLIRLLALCHQKLKFGYYIVVETVNPLSFMSFVNFYIDLTHKRPVHPETLQFLISAAGFRETEKKFFSKVSEASRLKKIIISPELDESTRKNAEVNNQNIEILNTILFGFQDYAIIGKK